MQTQLFSSRAELLTRVVRKAIFYQYHSARRGSLPRPFTIGALIVTALVLMNGVAFANGGNALYTITDGKYTGKALTVNTVSFAFDRPDTDPKNLGNPIAASVSISFNVNPGDSAEVIANRISDLLKGYVAPMGVFILKDYVDVGAPTLVNKKYVIKCTPKANVKIFLNAGRERALPGGIVTAKSLDPQIGQASFKLSGTPHGDGTVTLGIDGQQVSENTYDPGTGLPLSLTSILPTLKSELAALGINDASLGSSMDTLTLFNVSTGDPLGSNAVDIGAFLETTDTGLSTYAAVSLPDSGSATPVALGLIALMIWSYSKIQPTSAAVRGRRARKAISHQ
jgi:hypothetical protein